MSYQKPELFVLNHATTSVRSGSDHGGSGGSDSTKSHVVAEVGGDTVSDSNTNSTTSSTGGAYESDE